MVELLSTYGITQIIIFIVLLAIAIKGVVSFFDWAKERLSKFFGKETKAQIEKENLQKRLDNTDKKIERLEVGEEKLMETLDNVSDKIDLLISSDKDDIKAWITEKHHKYCAKGWIDDYTMDCLEKRYSHYESEGGNSFIANLMKELRKLKKLPPQ